MAQVLSQMILFLDNLEGIMKVLELGLQKEPENGMERPELSQL